MRIASWLGVAVVAVILLAAGVPAEDEYTPEQRKIIEELKSQQGWQDADVSDIGEDYIFLFEEKAWFADFYTIRKKAGSEKTYDVLYTKNDAPFSEESYKPDQLVNIYDFHSPDTYIKQEYKGKELKDGYAVVDGKRLELPTIRVGSEHSDDFTGPQVPRYGPYGEIQVKPDELTFDDQGRLVLTDGAKANYVNPPDYFVVTDKGFAVLETPVDPDTDTETPLENDLQDGAEDDASDEGADGSQDNKDNEQEQPEDSTPDTTTPTTEDDTSQDPEGDEEGAKTGDDDKEEDNSNIITLPDKSTASYEGLKDNKNWNSNARAIEYNGFFYRYNEDGTGYAFHPEENIIKVNTGDGFESIQASQAVYNAITSSDPSAIESIEDKGEVAYTINFNRNQQDRDLGLSYNAIFVTGHLVQGETDGGSTTRFMTVNSQTGEKLTLFEKIEAGELSYTQTYTADDQDDPDKVIIMNANGDQSKKVDYEAFSKAFGDSPRDISNLASQDQLYLVLTEVDLDDADEIIRRSTDNLVGLARGDSGCYDCLRIYTEGKAIYVSQLEGKTIRIFDTTTQTDGKKIADIRSEKIIYTEEIKVDGKTVTPKGTIELIERDETGKVTKHRRSYIDQKTDSEGNAYMVRVDEFCPDNTCDEDSDNWKVIPEQKSGCDQYTGSVRTNCRREWDQVDFEERGIDELFGGLQSTQRLLIDMSRYVDTYTARAITGATMYNRIVNLFGGDDAYSDLWGIQSQVFDELYEDIRIGGLAFTDQAISKACFENIYEKKVTQGSVAFSYSSDPSTSVDARRGGRQVITDPFGQLVESAYIVAERSEPITYPNGTTQYFIKVTFMLAAINEDVQFKLLFKYPGGQKIVTDSWYTVKKGETGRWVGERAVVGYTGKRYEQACFKFANSNFEGTYMFTTDSDDPNRNCVPFVVSNRGYDNFNFANYEPPGILLVGPSDPQAPESGGEGSSGNWDQDFEI